MAVNLGRERPNPPHLNPSAPQAQNIANALQRLRYTAVRLGNEAAQQSGRPPLAKSGYNHGVGRGMDGPMNGMSQGS